MENYYEILEVNQKASDEIIKKVFKIHVKKNHPDLFQGNEKLLAEEKIKKYNEAYETLSDSNKRKQYDEQVKNLETEQQAQQIDYEKYSTVQNILREENEYLKEELYRKQDLINYYSNLLNINIPYETNQSYEEVQEQYYNHSKDNQVQKSKKSSIVDHYSRIIVTTFIKIAAIIFGILIILLVAKLILDNSPKTENVNELFNTIYVP